MQHISIKRMMAWLLAIVMIIGLMPTNALTVFAADATQETIYVLAGSDYQADSGDAAGTTNINNIITQIKAAGYTAMDGFLFAGDYSVGATQTSNVTALKNTILNAGLGLTEDDMVLVQGNHDNSASYSGAEAGLVGSVLNEGGANDKEHYGVFVINEEDYNWKGKNEALVKQTAEELDAYLDAKVAAKYDAPIFVVSHLPLNYNMRTKNDGDGMYANLLFDVLNEAGNAGLNIIFMFGHDHSNGWDDYLGGSAIYLKKGDKINIAQGSQTTWKEETLAFTYMNSGYVGYYRNVNNGAETDLTMTVFAITGSTVTVERYSASGKHDLKSAGVTNSYKSESGYSPNATVYSSPQTITLQKFIAGNTVSSNGVSVTAPNLTGLTVTKLFGTADTSRYNTNHYSAYASYDIAPVGYTQGDAAEVTITLDTDDGFDASKPVIVIDKAKNQYTTKNIVGGKVTFTTDHFSTYDVAQIRSTEIEVPIVSAGTTERTYTRVTSTSELVSGGQYLIIHNGQSDFMIPVVTSDGGTRIGYDLVTGPDGLGDNTITGDYQEYEWTFTSVSGGWNIGSDAGYMYFEAAGSRHAAQLGATAHTMVIGGSANAFTFTNATYNGGSYVLNYNSTGDLINGYGSGAATFYIYRLTSTGSSGGPTVTESNKGWVEITAPVAGTPEVPGTPASTKYVYTLDTDGIVTDKADAAQGYLIVGSNNNNYAMTDSLGRTGVTITNNAITLDAQPDYEWWITADGKITDGTNYLKFTGTYQNYQASGSVSVTTNASEATKWDISYSSNGAYSISYTYSYGNLVNRKTTYYLRYHSKAFSVTSSSSTVRLFSGAEVTTPGTEGTPAVPGTDGTWYKISGDLGYNVAAGTSPEAALAAVKAGIDGYKYVGASKPGAAVVGTKVDDSELSWTLDESYGDGTTPGEYAVTISKDGKVLGVAKVIVPEGTLKLTVTIDSVSGSVAVGSGFNTKTGSTLTVTDENGNVTTVPVTVKMLKDADGNTISTAEKGTLTGLKVYYIYNGVSYAVFTDYTLNVTAKSGNNYPEYPNEGAVKVNKTATGIDFQSSGIAQVELSASGVPVKKGADVIVMLDLSSSMDSNKITVDGKEKSRLQVLRESMTVLLNQLQADDAEGNPLDIRIAVADFNRYYLDSDSPYYQNSADHMTGGSIRTNDDGTNKVYTGTNGLSAGAFVDVHDISATAFETTTTTDQYYLGYQSGTNYDYAFDAIYQLGAAITEDNENNGEERDLFVIFMSDGAPFQYNYYSEKSETTIWNDWLTGKATPDQMAGNQTYYNPEGKHWMAEAIKGTAGEPYNVIRKNDPSDDDGDNWVTVSGLGATIYSIGFCLAVDKQITVASMDTVIRNIASEEKYYYRADSADDLSAAFASIGNDIAYAASNARFVDQMGSNFNLLINTSTYEVLENGNLVEKTLAPKIEIISYDIYTKTEADAGTIPEGKNIGDRKGTYTVLETVTFNTDGTEAYSDKIGGGTEDILIDGVICAQYFWYNTNSTEVTISGVNIPTGTNADGTTTGSTSVLPAETFYWKMGTVQTSELAMRYYVYLDGSMEGTKPAGSYATNEYAVLYYDNYLGNSCKLDTVSPNTAWKEANVSYAFYLVNENGEIIVNQTTGQTGSFANKVAVTNPVLYETVLLNNEDMMRALEVQAISEDVLPKYYDLYDDAAVYYIHIYSNGTGAWEITSSEEVKTTYVTQYDPDDASAYSNELLNGIDAEGKQVVTGNDYTHTVVWFAVVWKPQAHPDSVVVDYGLPVDIHVLTNDMFGESGELKGIGSVGALPEKYDDTGVHTTILDSTAFTSSYTGQYGTAVADFDTGTIRYTLNTMQMNSYDQFAYAVHYTATGVQAEDATGYYYDIVTVIPATTIYYEDSFLTFGGTATWETVGSAATDTTQDEDRPGQYAIQDANNIYGYDSVNKGMSTFSLGTAKKVTVDANTYGTAEFTFYGTGFDVISMTSNETGVLIVQVFAGATASGTAVTTKLVDTYYGYEQVEGDADGDGVIEEGEMIWVATPDINRAIYQVPVIQVKDLVYGQYTVKITASYYDALNNDRVEREDGKTYGDGSYDLYLDAIRIYDPANDGEGNTMIEDAYKVDGEGWPSFIELRNKIIEAGSFVNVDNDVLTTDMEGLVFIDGDASVGDAQLSDYVNYGPNNEVYLAPGQSVAFIVDAPDNLANLHIALKSANGTPVTYTLYNVARQSYGEDKVQMGDVYNNKEFTVDTTTEMYYDLTSWSHNNDIIVIANASSESSNAVLSITNIKSTYTSNPNDNETADSNSTETVQTYSVQMLSATAEDTATESNETTIYMTPAAATLALRAVNTMYLPEVFEPEQVEIEVGKGKIKEGDKVKVTVKTSDDVEYITVNGETVTRYRTDRRTGERIWTVTLKAEEAGELNIEVVVYDADDLASDPVTETVTVEAKKDPRERAREILKDLFGRCFG